MVNVYCAESFSRRKIIRRRIVYYFTIKKMTKVTALLLVLFTAHITHAQDTITKKNGEMSDSLYLRGQMDAFKFYNDYHDAGMAILVASLASPVGGLIPAIACSGTPPKTQNLNCPDIQLFTNSGSYYRGYTEGARKIKNNRVWKSWFTGFGVNMAVAVLIVFSNH